MFSTASIYKFATAAAALGVSVSVILAPVAARGEAAHSPRGDAARVGNWVGAPHVRQNNQKNRIRAATDVAKIKLIARAEDQENCGDTLFVPARPRKCPGDSVSPEIASGENTDQTATSSLQETPVRNPKSGVVEIEPRIDENAPPLKSTARLNVEEPEQVKPEASVNPNPVQPKGLEKDQPAPPSLLSCDKAGAIVGSYGFNGIKPSDCDGQVFSFNASRDGKPFIVTLNAESGELIQVHKVR